MFLHRIVPGGADRSYGVHVAQLAGMPSSIIHRAWELLKELEHGSMNNKQPSAGRTERRAPPIEQLSLIGSPVPALDELLSLDINAMTPMDALNKLYELQTKARDST